MTCVMYKPAQKRVPRWSSQIPGSQRESISIPQQQTPQQQQQGTGAVAPHSLPMSIAGYGAQAVAPQPHFNQDRGF